jgi:acetyl-CoA synthetase
VTTIHKSPEDLRVTPNLVDYDRTRAEFDWSTVPSPCADMPAGG